MRPARRAQPSLRCLASIVAMLLLTACAGGGDGWSPGVPRCDRNGDQEQRKAC